MGNAESSVPEMEIETGIDEPGRSPVERTTTRP
jgi:hypothetical protein